MNYVRNKLIDFALWLLKGRVVDVVKFNKKTFWVRMPTGEIIKRRNRYLIKDKLID